MEVKEQVWIMRTVTCIARAGGEEGSEKQRGNLLAFRVRVAQLCGTDEIIAILF